MPSVVHFGHDALGRLGAAVAERGARRVLVVSDEPVVAARIVGEAVDRLAGAGVRASVFTGAPPSPARADVERCRDEIAARPVDAVVAVGGGSVIDVAKAAVALHAAAVPLPELYGLGKAPRTGVLPVVAVSTTPCTGAEISAHATIADPDTGGKHAISGPALVPAVAVVQPSLAASLPWEVTVASGLDGFLHATEAFLARRATAVTDLFALPAAALVADGLTRLAAGEDGWEPLSRGCLYAGIAMANANAGLVHALGYPLTTRYGIPHGLANTLVAPAVLAASRACHADRDVHLASSLRARSMADAVAGLRATLGLADGLRAHRVDADDVPVLAGLSLSYGPIRRNWRLDAGREETERIYRAAW